MDVSGVDKTDEAWTHFLSVNRMDPQADVKRLPHAEPMDLEHLNLASLLDFRPDQGIIRLHEQRVVILSAAAMGLLRKELIDTLGLETARRLMLRFGYADGYHDAVSLRDRSNGRTRWKASGRAPCFTGLKGSSGPKSPRSNTMPLPADSRRKCSGTIPTRPNSTCTTMARATCRCAGLWRAMRAGT